MMLSDKVAYLANFGLDLIWLAFDQLGMLLNVVRQLIELIRVLVHLFNQFGSFKSVQSKQTDVASELPHVVLVVGFTFVQVVCLHDFNIQLLFGFFRLLFLFYFTQLSFFLVFLFFQHFFILFVEVDLLYWRLSVLWHLGKDLLHWCVDVENLHVFDTWFSNHLSQGFVFLLKIR